MTTGAAFRRILAPTDFSPESAAAWETAQALARALDAELVLLHVQSEAPLYGEGVYSTQRLRELYAAAREWAEKTLEEMAAAARASGLRVQTRLRTGTPHAEIVAAVAEEGADLVVIGTHGRGGLDRALLGSVADRVVRRAPCPVVTVRARE